MSALAAGLTAAPAKSRGEQPAVRTHSGSTTPYGHRRSVQSQSGTVQNIPSTEGENTTSTYLPGLSHLTTPGFRLPLDLLLVNSTGRYWPFMAVAHHTPSSRNAGLQRTTCFGS